MLSPVHLDKGMRVTFQAVFYDPSKAGDRMAAAHTSALSYLRSQASSIRSFLASYCLNIDLEQLLHQQKNPLQWFAIQIEYSSGGGCLKDDDITRFIQSLMSNTVEHSLLQFNSNIALWMSILECCAVKTQFIDQVLLFVSRPGLINSHFHCPLRRLTLSFLECSAFLPAVAKFAADKAQTLRFELPTASSASALFGASFLSGQPSASAAPSFLSSSSLSSSSSFLSSSSSLSSQLSLAFTSQSTSSSSSSSANSQPSAPVLPPTASQSSRAIMHVVALVRLLFDFFPSQSVSAPGMTEIMNCLEILFLRFRQYLAPALLKAVNQALQLHELALTQSHITAGSQGRSHRLSLSSLPIADFDEQESGHHSWDLSHESASIFPPPKELLLPARDVINRLSALKIPMIGSFPSPERYINCNRRNVSPHLSFLWFWFVWFSYLDTHFQLLRAECFVKFQEALNQIQKGNAGAYLLLDHSQIVGLHFLPFGQPLALHPTSYHFVFCQDVGWLIVCISLMMTRGKVQICMVASGVPSIGVQRVTSDMGTLCSYLLTTFKLSIGRLSLAVIPRYFNKASRSSVSLKTTSCDWNRQWKLLCLELVLPPQE